MADRTDLKKAGYSIVITGFIGLEGTRRLAEEYRERIDAVYPAYLVRRALEFGGEKDERLHENAVSALAKHLEAFGVKDNEGAYYTEAAEGGILTALYELAKVSSLGFEIDLRKIPVRQETIEICELLEVNPYHLFSGGCMVCIVPEGGTFAEKLAKEGVNAVPVGYTTDKKAHILHNDGTESYLNRPEPDELIRLQML